jgi:hypothetical protein
VIHLKTHTKLLAVVGAALMALILGVPAANAEKPEAPYEQFAGCPNPETENPESLICLRTVVTGGHLQMGTKDVPISKTLTVTGGTDENFGNFDANSEGGFSPTQLEVPGGIVGLTGLEFLLKILNVNQLKLFAVAELAGTPDLNPFEIPIELPIKAHLINPVLGNNCYIGSNEDPIELNLTVETTNPLPPNEPITGKPANFSFDEETLITHGDDGIFVDNEFAAPAANGCQLKLPLLPPVNIDSIVNSQAGLPSPAGTNETVQEFDLEAVESEVVYP